MHQSRKEEESLVSPFVGRPNFPERILEELPNLTNLEYLRYRVTGELPEHITKQLEKDAQKFIEAGLKEASLPKVPHFNPKDFVAPESKEELKERIGILESRARELVANHPFSFAEGKSFAEEVHYTAVAARDRFHETLSSREFDTACSALLVSLQKQNITAEERAGTILAHTALRDPTSPDEWSLRKRIDSVIREGHYEAVRLLLEVPMVQGAVAYAIRSIDASELTADQAVDVLNSVMPELDTLSKEQRYCYVEGDHMLGSHGYKVCSLLDRTANSHKPLSDEALSRIAELLTKSTSNYLRCERFLCHINALGVLTALSAIHYSKDITPRDPEGLRTLLKQVNEVKVKDYRDSYSVVNKVKSEIRILHKRLEGVEISEQEFSRSFPEKVGKLFRDYAPGFILRMFSPSKTGESISG